MTSLNVLIDYKPRIYTDVFGRLLKKLGEVNVVGNHSLEAELDWNTIDLVVLSVDREGQPEIQMLPEPLPPAMLVAISPCGNLGMLRKPGDERWKVVRPFGFGELVQMIIGGQRNGNRELA